MRKVLIMGLPGAGKTTLARALVPLLNAVHFNADEVRTHVSKDLGFSLEDRIEHARRMGWLCDRVVETGAFAIADLICPTESTRAAFGDAFVVWVDRVKESRFEDTNRLFEPPRRYDIRIGSDGTPSYWALELYERLLPRFNSKAATALFLGRYQPFHEGHLRLIEEGIKRVGQACIAVRDTHGTGLNNPFDVGAVKARIEAMLWRYRGRFNVVAVPNITHVFYGRDVGYVVERLDLDSATHEISATKLRGELVAPTR